MIYEFQQGSKPTALKKIDAAWRPSEKELENALIENDENSSETKYLRMDIFGEDLLLINNQVRTRQGKRADIVAVDKQGHGVFIELKKDKAKRGVETQTLQYLANYAKLTGEDFLNKILGKSEGEKLTDALDEFIDDYSPEKLNSKSRIILIAQDFDATLFSMGEWLADRGVPFRCIRYTPIEIDKRKFISFSIAFDRSKEFTYRLSPGRTSIGYFWYNIGKPPGLGGYSIEALDKWWGFLKKEGLITAGFSNQPGDRGEEILKSFQQGDFILVYCSNRGAIGWGVVKSQKYELVEAGRDEYAKSEDHLHRLYGIEWKAVASSVKDAIPADEVNKEYGIYHPFQTKSGIKNSAAAKKLIDTMNAKFPSTGKG